MPSHRFLRWGDLGMATHVSLCLRAQPTTLGVLLGSCAAAFKEVRLIPELLETVLSN